MLSHCITDLPEGATVSRVSETETNIILVTGETVPVPLCTCSYATVLQCSMQYTYCFDVWQSSISLQHMLLYHLILRYCACLTVLIVAWCARVHVYCCVGAGRPKVNRTNPTLRRNSPKSTQPPTTEAEEGQGQGQRQVSQLPPDYDGWLQYVRCNSQTTGGMLL